ERKCTQCDHNCGSQHVQISFSDGDMSHGTPTDCRSGSTNSTGSERSSTGIRRYRYAKQCPDGAHRGVMHRRSGAVAKDKHDPCGGIFSLKGSFPNDDCWEQILLEQGRIKRRLEEEKEREIEQTEQVRRNLEQKDREEEWVPLQAGTLHCDVRTGVRRGFVATLQRIPSILPGGCQKVLDSFGWWHYLPKVG